MHGGTGGGSGGTYPIQPIQPTPPPAVVYITPSPFLIPAWEMAAKAAYEAMEAYYLALTEKLSTEKEGASE